MDLADCLQGKTGKREQACKPNFVPRKNRGGDHSSSPVIAGGVKRPTRELPAERVTPPPLFGLAPCGVYPVPHLTMGAVRSYIKPLARPHLFALTASQPWQARGDAGGIFSVALSVPEAYVRLREIPLRPSLLASTLPCGVRTFLSSAPACLSRAPKGPNQTPERSSDHPACSHYQNL